MTSCVIERLDKIYFKLSNCIDLGNNRGLPSLSLGKVGGKLTILAGDTEWYGNKSSCIVMYVYGIRVAMPSNVFSEISLAAEGNDVTSEVMQIHVNNLNN
jgi:hypothetical protein